MSKLKSWISAGLIASTMTIAAIGGAAADQPTGVDWNANDTNSVNSDNCIAYYSAPHRHNGLGDTLGQGDASHGQRGDEIKYLQATCGAQA